MLQASHVHLGLCYHSSYTTHPHQPTRLILTGFLAGGYSFRSVFLLEAFLKSPGGGASASLNSIKTHAYRCICTYVYMYLPQTISEWQEVYTTASSFMVQIPQGQRPLWISSALQRMKFIKCLRIKLSKTTDEIRKNCMITEFKIPRESY